MLNTSNCYNWEKHNASKTNGEGNLSFEKVCSEIRHEIANQDLILERKNHLSTKIQRDSLINGSLSDVSITPKARILQDTG